ncbi:MAG: preprotein translocase subunit SecE [Candidatus Andersenbacteria bacterium]|nr:preprotein translocase subunit SecE [Candidatus Andersenbacteria bacterium]
MTTEKITSLIQWPNQAARFVREARDELKKVSWPNRATTVRYTIIVVAASLAVGFVIGGIDYLFSLLLQRVI